MGGLLGRHDRCRGPRGLRADEGFSIVEVLVAIGLFGIIATFVAGALASGLRGTLLGKRRQVATQEASRVIEVARSVAYAELGLATTDPTIDPAHDPAIVTIDGMKKYLVDPSPATYEPIIFAPNLVGNPFNPHKANVHRGSTELTSYVYVTGHDADSDGAIDYKRVTARVVWNESGTSGPANEVRTATFVHPGNNVAAPQGAGGGITPTKAAASAQAPSVSVRSDAGTLSPPADAALPVAPVVATGPTSTGNTSFRAVADATCTATSTSLQGSTATYGGHAVSASADDDARTATGPNPPDQTWNGSDVTVGSGDDVDRLLLQGSVTSPVSCHASAQDQDGAEPADDDLPYEHGTGSGETALNLNESVAGAGLPTSELNVVDLATMSVDQATDHAVVGGTRELSSTARVSSGTTKLMVLSGLMPNGLVRVDPFEFGATTTASPTTPSRPPAVSAGGTLAIWIFDPSLTLTACTSRSGDYCRLDISPLQSGFAGIDAQVSGSVSGNAGLTTITYATTVHALPPTVSSIGGEIGPAGEKRWQATYAPISVSTTMTITVHLPLGLSVKLVDSAVDLTYGSVSASGCSGVAC